VRLVTLCDGSRYAVGLRLPIDRQCHRALPVASDRYATACDGRFYASCEKLSSAKGDSTMNKPRARFIYAGEDTQPSQPCNSQQPERIASESSIATAAPPAWGLPAVGGAVRSVRFVSSRCSALRCAAIDRSASPDRRSPCSALELFVTFEGAEAATFNFADNLVILLEKKPRDGVEPKHLHRHRHGPIFRPPARPPAREYSCTPTSACPPAREYSSTPCFRPPARHACKRCTRGADCACGSTSGRGWTAAGGIRCGLMETPRSERPPTFSHSVTGGTRMVHGLCSDGSGSALRGRVDNAVTYRFRYTSATTRHRGRNGPHAT
jgi:hypothetical protein